MKNKSFIVILALLVAVLLAAVPLYRNLSGQENVSLGTVDQQQTAVVPAPDFTFYTLDGTKANLSDYLGKPVVLNFWSSNCGPCRSEMPEFQTAFDSLGGEVQFLMVNVTDGYWDTLETASAYIDGEGYTFPVFYDTDNHAAYTYGLRGLPYTFFINAEGNVVGQRSGAMNLDILMGGIALINR